jgi:hypothetical protein
MCVEACCRGIDWASWLAAIGTLLAVVVVLGIEGWKSLVAHINRAKLDMEMRFEPPDCHRGGNEYYFRLWVTNPGKTRARNVQVFLKDVANRSLDGAFVRNTALLPQYLVWSHTPQPKDEKEFAGISPAMGRHCELGVVAGPSSIYFDGRLVFRPWVKVRTSAYALPRGAYRFTLLVAADNVLPIERRLDIEFHGEWFENESDMLRSGISIKSAA